MSLTWLLTWASFSLRLQAQVHIVWAAREELQRNSPGSIAARSDTSCSVELYLLHRLSDSGRLGVTIWLEPGGFTDFSGN